MGWTDMSFFEQIGSAFERDTKVSKVMLGNGMLRFMRQRELVDYAVEWMEKNRT